MNTDLIRELENLDYTTISLPELLLIQSFQMLTWYEHSKEFIEVQRITIEKLDIRAVIKNICTLILNEVKIKDN